MHIDPWLHSCNGGDLIRESIYYLYMPASRSTARVLASFPISRLPQNTRCIIYQTDCIQRLMYSKLFTVVPLQLMFQVTKQSLSKLLNRHDSIWWLLLSPEKYDALPYLECQYLEGWTFLEVKEEIWSSSRVFNFILLKV